MNPQCVVGTGQSSQRRLLLLFIIIIVITRSYIAHHTISFCRPCARTKEESCILACEFSQCGNVQKSPAQIYTNPD